MLSVQGLTAHYGTSQALFGIDFQIASGEVVTLLSVENVTRRYRLPRQALLTPPAVLTAVDCAQCGQRLGREREQGM